MSYWTHIAAIIRIDSWEHKENLIIKQIMNNAPKGSEGGLQFSIWENPKLNDLTAYTLSIFGDLRDFHNQEDINSLRQWWKDSLALLGLDSIRSSVMKIDTSGQNPIILIDEDE